jgi:energy-coupling factor transport system substrate-specific component
MRELIQCWQQTRMIVLIGLCAALYVAVLLPFKIATLIPGITEIRPGAALPVVFSLFFGPAAAWGAGFGNIIGDVLGGTIGPGSLFGAAANFLLGYAPYRILRNYRNPDSKIFTGKGWISFVFLVVVSSGLCALIIALGLSFLGLFQFEVTVHPIFLNNFLMSLLLAPVLIRTLRDRIHHMNLSYTQLLEPDQISRPLLGKAGPPIILAVMILIYLLMMNPALLSSIHLNPSKFALLASVILPILALLLI